MTSTFVLAAALAVAPAQTPAGGPSVGNVRFTFRDLGTTRPDNRFVPGDVVFLSFDIEGLKVGDDGKAAYSMGMEVLDKAGKALFTAPPARSEIVLPLGGSKLPANVFATVGPDMPPGPYTCRVNVGDGSPGGNRSFDKQFEVLPAAFAMVALMVSSDAQGNIPNGMSGVVGQTVFVNFALVGFGRDKDKKPVAAVDLRVLDDAGRPVLAKPITAALPRDLAERDQLVPFQFPLPLNREGSFTVELRAADRVTNKTAALSFPIRVHPASK